MEIIDLKEVYCTTSTLAMEKLEIVEVFFDQPEYTDFMEKWGEEVESIFPHYSEEDADYGHVLMLHYNGKVAGMFVYEHKGEELHIACDYVTPEFRDLGIGKAFFQQKVKEFRSAGIAQLIALTDNDAHRQYLVDAGFVLSNVHPDRYEMEFE